jgi:hypothetical protein
MPIVDSNTYISSTNITSIKIGDEVVERVFVGENLVFCRGDACCSEATAPVKMTGWVVGERTLTPIGYAPYGRETYLYGDEAVRYETGVWLYTNTTYGELARAYSYAARPWLVNWPAPFTAEQVCAPCVSGCTDNTATNYNPNATCDDGSCVQCVYGCTDSNADNYNQLATCDDFSCDGDFGSSGFKWMRMLSVDSTTAFGIGQNNITVSITQSVGGMFSHANGAVGGTVFPEEYGVPISGNQIGNTQAGVFTAVFSEPVTDALVAFASVGQGGTPVQVQVRDENGAPKPFTPIWALDGATTYQNMTGVGPNFQYTEFIGEEGYNIIRIDGTMSSVTFNYTVSENYCTICFGFVDQNTP